MRFGTTLIFFCRQPVHASTLSESEVRFLFSVGSLKLVSTLGHSASETVDSKILSLPSHGDAEFSGTDVESVIIKDESKILASMLLKEDPMIGDWVQFTRVKESPRSLAQ